MVKSIEQVVEDNRRTGRGHDDDGEPRAFTDREFFDISCEMGLNQTNPEYRALFDHLADWVKRRLPIRSAIEIGSGPGYLLYCLNRRGIDCTGVDGNPYSRNFFREQHPEFADKYRLDRHFEDDYAPADALFSIEVFEHIPDDGLATIMEKVTAQIRPRCIVFSSTPHADPHPGWDLQWGHINLKQPDQWHEFFERYGYVLHEAKPPVTEWASLYLDRAGVT